MSDVAAFNAIVFVPDMNMVSGGVIAICLVLLVIIFVRFLLPRSLTL
jgi:hypothetical protein